MRQITTQLLVLGLTVGAGGALAAQPGGGKPPKQGGSTLLAAPTGVAVSSNASALTVSWGNVANATGYQVNRREGGTVVVTLASGLTGTPYTGPLATPGTAFEYQVVAFGGKNKAASQWVSYTVPIAAPAPGTTPGVIVTEPRPTTGTITPTIVPSAPAYLNAGSNIPGQIWLTWKEVTSATGYRVTRSSNAPEPETKIAEMSSTSQLAEGGIWSYVNAPVDERWTYTYRVYALNSGNASPSSPTATAKSMAAAAPTGLKYSVALTSTPGRINVTLSWTAVPNAVKYVITGLGFTGTPSTIVTSPTYTVNNILASGATVRICVYAVYPYDVQDAAATACIDVKI